jgi:hypothetical protein
MARSIAQLNRLRFFFFVQHKRKNFDFILSFADCQSDRGMSDNKLGNNNATAIASISTYLPGSTPPSPKTTATQGTCTQAPPL